MKESSRILAFIFLLLGGIYYEDIYYLFVKEDKLSADLPVYVINLDRTPERYKKINAQLDKYGVRHQRFSAVDGYNIKIENLKTGETFFGYDLKNGNKRIQGDISYKVYCPHFAINYIPVKIANHRSNFLTAGEFGCDCSHIEIWNEMKNQQIPYALIFEDDAILKKDFGSKLDKVIANLPEVWDILFLYFTGHKSTTQIAPNIVSLNQDEFEIGTSSSYLISNNGAQRMLKEFGHFSITIDHEISGKINEGKIIAFAADPFIATTLFPIFNYPFSSTIGDMGRILKF